MGDFRVTAPYVVLKMKDPVSGKAMVNGFYKGAIVSGDRVEEVSLKRHIDRDWVEVVEAAPAPPVGDSGADQGAGEGDAGADQGSGDDGGDQPPAKPAQADPKPMWVDYAVAMGNDRDAAESMTKADLIELLK